MHDFGEGRDDVSVQTHHCYWEIRTQSLKPFGGGGKIVIMQVNTFAFGMICLSASV